MLLKKKKPTACISEANECKEANQCEYGVCLVNSLGCFG